MMDDVGVEGMCGEGDEEEWDRMGGSRGGLMNC